MKWHGLILTLCLALLPVCLKAASSAPPSGTSPSSSSSSSSSTTTTTTTTSSVEPASLSTSNQSASVTGSSLDVDTTSDSPSSTTTPNTTQSTSANATTTSSSTSASGSPSQQQTTPPANPNTNSTAAVDISTTSSNTTSTPSTTTPLTHSSVSAGAGTTTESASSSAVTPSTSPVTNSTASKPETTTAEEQSTETTGKPQTSPTTHDNVTSTPPSTSTPSAVTNSSEASSSVVPNTSNPATPATSSTSTPSPTTTTAPTPPLRISETNILLVDPTAEDSLFVELKGAPNETIEEMWLLIRDASKPLEANPLLRLNLPTSLDDNGLLVVKNSSSPGWVTNLDGVQAVLIALFRSEESATSLNVTDLVDVLLYSSEEDIDNGILELFSGKVPIQLKVDRQSLKNLGTISLSRCSDGISNAAFVVTQASQGAGNNCSFSQRKPLEMALTRQDSSCHQTSFDDGFNNTLTDAIIEGVSKKQQCGFGRLMISGMMIDKKCSEADEQIAVHFTVRSGFVEQLDLVMDGYRSFVSDREPLVIDLGTFEKVNCTENCFPSVTPPKKSDGDDKIRVTIAVVVSCIGVFLLVVLFVVLYMRRKKKGILQFRMTRLDEDEDDLIGDMDDFVGNQGPTFRNFR